MTHAFLSGWAETPTLWVTQLQKKLGYMGHPFSWSVSSFGKESLTPSSEKKEWHHQFVHLFQTVISSLHREGLWDNDLSVCDVLRLQMSRNIQEINDWNYFLFWLFLVHTSSPTGGISAHSFIYFIYRSNIAQAATRSLPSSWCCRPVAAWSWGGKSAMGCSPKKTVWYIKH